MRNERLQVFKNRSNWAIMPTSPLCFPLHLLVITPLEPPPTLTAVYTYSTHTLKETLSAWLSSVSLCMCVCVSLLAVSSLLFSYFLLGGYFEINPFFSAVLCCIFSLGFTLCQCVNRKSKQSRAGTSGPAHTCRLKLLFHCMVPAQRYYQVALSPLQIVPLRSSWLL